MSLKGLVTTQRLKNWNAPIARGSTNYANNMGTFIFSFIVLLAIIMSFAVVTANGALAMFVILAAFVGAILFAVIKLFTIK